MHVVLAIILVILGGKPVDADIVAIIGMPTLDLKACEAVVQKEIDAQGPLPKVGPLTPVAVPLCVDTGRVAPAPGPTL